MAKPTQLSASLYVGDLALDVTEGQIFELFNPVGMVASIRVCRDAVTRRSLGYAYVNFHNFKDAELVLDTKNNSLIKGRPCRIMWSQRDPSVRKSGVGNIFIKNLDPDIGHKELNDTFSVFGNILSCKVALNDNNLSKGYGFVHFETEESAQKAINKLNGMIIGTKKVYVGKFIPKKERFKQQEASWTNVYLKNLDRDKTDADLENIFGRFGEITSARVMLDDSKVSRGFGFVNFRKHESAVAAVDEVNKGNMKNADGVPFYAARAQKKAERLAELRRKFEQLRIERSSQYQGINLYLKNIEDEVNEERLRKEFSPFGNITSVKIATDSYSGLSKGFGFICFSTQDEAQRAMNEMNGKILHGCLKPLYVALHEPKELRVQKLATYYAQRSKSLRSGNVAPVPPLGYPPQVYFSNQFIAPMMNPRNPQYTRWTASANPSYPVGNFPSVQQTNQRQPKRSANNNTNGGPSNPPPSNAKRNTSHTQTEQSTQTSQEQTADITTLPPDQQKLMVGEKLYRLVHQKQPNLAGKITGMLLDGEMEDLLQLLDNEENLSSKIEEAVRVLDEAKKSDHSQESKDAQ
eukprot:TRINITY_DN560_c0_g2_i1.p1 TRINITY_DN560_c0_g2~~TRINITY_DN560_c0_g2_i1.p1  ORF type:complete len:578 (-),score=90.05 TRINITY_DN560_c0_g2_i1:44-1777(-)